MYYNGMNQNPGAIPPAAYGNTMIPLNYEQRLVYGHDLRKQQKEFVEKKLREEYPAKFVIVYSIIMTLISIGLIVLHIILIVFNGAYFYIYHGIWGGLVSLVIPLMASLLIKFPKYPFYLATFIISILINTLVILAVIMISGFSLMEYEEQVSRYASSTSNVNKDMLPVTAVMLALAIIQFILHFVYITVVGRIFRKPRATVNYNGGTIYPNNIAANPSATYYPQNLQQNPVYPANTINMTANTNFVQNSALY
ncbi:hypothetical protein BpHYR1_003405 [Brachionus plicatilis]|uniref:Uncharacterized protein n=1 Tax=Brachionus plicatilis TaxID=10195 RepID=A0A3M7PSN1_BRAPC|nr:hypothetical protein BpHYR1_003405 [Brachionus plicatilis]